MTNYIKQIKSGKLDGKGINLLRKSGKITQAELHILKGVANDQARDDVIVLREVIAKLVDLVKSQGDELYTLKNNHLNHLQHDMENVLTKLKIEKWK